MASAKTLLFGRRFGFARIAAACAFIFGLAAPPASAAGKTTVVLIGASGYRHLPPDKSLRAPANDVRRMKAALIARGVRAGDIATYADGVEGSIADPTASMIAEVFDALPGRIGAGDNIIIYMSGHGTQIPDDNGDEDDGFDEAFLPVDAIPPQPGATRFDMTNVIRDDQPDMRAVNEEQRAKEISAT